MKEVQQANALIKFNQAEYDLGSLKASMQNSSAQVQGSWGTAGRNHL
jgi:hypothetical protein